MQSLPHYGHLAASCRVRTRMTTAEELRKWAEKHDGALNNGVHLNLSGFLQTETQQGAMFAIAKLLDILLERKAKIRSIDLSRNPQLGLHREWAAANKAAKAAASEDLD